MRNRSFVLDSEFYCVICGTKGIPVVRQKGKEREAGHLKKLFCLRCKVDTNHAECRPWTCYTHDDFVTEFENGNFDENGNRKRTYGELKQELNNRGML